MIVVAAVLLLAAGWAVGVPLFALPLALLCNAIEKKNKKSKKINTAIAIVAIDPSPSSLEVEFEFEQSPPSQQHASVLYAGPSQMPSPR